MSKHNTANQPLIFSQVVDAIVGKQGGTFGPDTDEPKFNGYFVGGSQPTVRVRNGEQLVTDLTKLAEVVELVRRAIGRGSNVGTWLNPETSEVEVDDSEWIESKSLAIETAQDRHELAIWDVKGEREINVGRFTADGDYVKLI